MILDVHVHISAFTAPHGSMSRKLLESLPFRFMRRVFDIPGNGLEAETCVRELLFRTLDEIREIDRITLLAFDAVHDHDGNFDAANTHLYVTNDYVIELAKQHPKILFAASVHPYRKDAVAELERCVKAGAVLVKWLPITQNFNPADAKCIPFYEALASLKIPLLSHTGTENALPNVAPETADPKLLTEALNRGVKVIAAHCGSRLLPWETDYVPVWARMAKEFEHFYGDTAALNVPNRWYAYDTILNDPALCEKLVHGSDWPILPAPPPRLGLKAGVELLSDRNWLRRDVQIKQKLGFDEAYWHRAARVLNLSV